MSDMGVTDRLLWKRTPESLDNPLWFGQGTVTWELPQGCTLLNLRAGHGGMNGLTVRDPLGHIFAIWFAEDEVRVEPLRIGDVFGHPRTERSA